MADALPTVIVQPAFGLLQRIAALGGHDGDADDGLPLPPSYLRVLTAGDADADAFLTVGRRAAETIVALSAAHGEPLDDDAGVLEFGVGCGRVARHLTRLRRDVAFHACDIDRRLLAWSRTHLPGRYDLTNAEPPLPYDDGAFRLTYALSVFTHMHEAPARAWLAELARVTAPGGLAVLSYLDEGLPQAAPIRELLLRDGYAVRREGAEGSNLMCGYFTVDGFAARAAPHWTLLESRPSGPELGQALAVFRRR